MWPSQTALGGMRIFSGIITQESRKTLRAQKNGLIEPLTLRH